MSRTFFELYVHLVWHTKFRRSILRGKLDELVHCEIRSRMQAHDLLPLAVGSAWDHVHAFAGWNGKTPIGKFVGEIKGATSFRWNNELRPDDAPRLEWQKGYGAISVEHANIDRIINYVDGQKRHHRHRDLRERLERSRPPDES